MSTNHCCPTSELTSLLLKTLLQPSLLTMDTGVLLHHTVFTFTYLINQSLPQNGLASVYDYSDPQRATMLQTALLNMC